MFKAVGRLFKSDTSMWILVAIVVAVLAWALMSYSGNKTKVRDALGNMGGAKPNMPDSSLASSSQPVSSGAPPASASKQLQPPSASSVVARPTLQPSDIVLNPVNVPDLIMSPTAFIGIDTIGNTLRNPTWDLRSDPPIPKQNVGPWNNSTIDADLQRVPFDIGACR
jgi:hypothetical protein